jgi:polyhydroxybutyrate depolymerase
MRDKRRRFVLIGSLLFLSILACARTRLVPATAAPGLPAGDSTHTLSFGGRTRSYLLYVPTSVDWSKAVPLVFVFHGGTGNAANAERMSGFDAVADRNGFLVAYPDGTGALSDDKLLTWNGGDCCGYSQTHNVDDVGFVRAIVADLQAQANIDAKRIYATGMSNGAILSQRLGCEAADVFAAIAPVAGTLNFSPCTPSQPVSVIEFHGTADQHIPYEGGYGPKSLVNVDFASVQKTIDFWTGFDGCSLQPLSDSHDDIQHQTWAGCRGATAVELYTIVGGGHAWPGGQGGWIDADPPTQTISASELIWAFFAAHPKP